MTGRSPPLPALRAFAAWVRLGSVAAAAEELKLTAGAVSHQIRALETFLDVALIERQARRWVLTEAGRIYGYQVRQALQDIVDVTERVRGHGRRTPTQDLRVAVLPSFANGWLLPRLQDFMRWHPLVRLHLLGSMAYADLDQGQVDCAIRFGHGRWPEADVQALMGDTLLLVAAPGQSDGVYRFHPSPGGCPSGSWGGAHTPIDRRSDAAKTGTGAGPSSRMPPRLGLLPVTAAGGTRACRARSLRRLAARGLRAVCPHSKLTRNLPRAGPNLGVTAAAGDSGGSFPVSRPVPAKRVFQQQRRHRDAVKPMNGMA